MLFVIPADVVIYAIFRHLSRNGYKRFMCKPSKKGSAHEISNDSTVTFIRHQTSSGVSGLSYTSFGHNSM